MCVQLCVAGRNASREVRQRLDGLVDVALPDVLKEAGLKIKDVDKILDVADHLVGILACAFLSDPPDLDFESDRYAKDTINEILQAQLDKFNALGENKK